MPESLHPFVRHLSEAEPYDQEEPGTAFFHTMIREDEIPGLSAGHVALEGPIRKTPATHADWHQAYFIYAGSGTIHLGTETYPVKAPAMVAIPKNTHHAIEVAEGQVLRYLYINQWR